MATRKKRRFLSPSRRITVVVLVLVAVIISGSLAYAKFGTTSDNPPAQTTDSNQTTENENGINLSPPTEQEKQETQQHKDELAQQQNQTGGSTSGKKQVQIEVYADKNTVNASVYGVFEEGGTCTATVTGPQTITRTSTGFGSASYTQCMPISTNLSSGQWSVTVTYSSANAEGTSQPYTLKVE